LARSFNIINTAASANLGLSLAKNALLTPAAHHSYGSTSDWVWRMIGCGGSVTMPGEVARLIGDFQLHLLVARYMLLVSRACCVGSARVMMGKRKAIALWIGILVFRH
jgi:hypothetical protein